MKCIIGGCARNIEKQLEVSLPDIIKIGEQFDEYSILIYENDSTDRTVDIIKTFQCDYPEINLISEKLVVGTRTEILSHGRNILLQQVIDNYSEYDFYIQMDLDYMRPTTFNMKNILQGWKSEWNGITAVSEHHYYDWYALIIDNKKQMWRPGIQPKCLIHGDNKDADHSLCESWACNACYKGDAQLGRGPTYIKHVISAFNGIGVYKISRIIEKDTCFYLGSKDGKQLCEHVMFHKCLGNIYIHPELVTQTVSECVNWSQYLNFNDDGSLANKYYGYDFTAQNSGGLAAIIHDVMNAFKYATDNNLTLGFIREGYEIPRLNGSYDDTSVPDKNWHSYFTSFEKIDRIDCVGVWPQVVVSAPEKTRDIETYSKIIRKNVCTFVPDVYDEICELVKQTPFNEITDIVVHIRLTDKKTETPVFLPIQKYIDECEYALLQLKDEINRIYICTDDQTVCQTLKSHFNSKNIEVVWDETESLEPIQTIRWKGGLKKSVAQLETMNAFKNMFILAYSKYRIGGRMSYFFRIAELLGYPNTSVNIQDNDKFGIAPYSNINYQIRPYKSKTFPNFINECITDFQLYNEIYKENGIITISNFVSDEIINSIRPEFENYKWWTYANLPHNGKWEVNYSKELCENSIQECEDAYVNKQFTYRFRRCLGNHYKTCNCVSCRLNDTVKSWPFTDTICKITGHKNIIPGEVFISNYGKGDFLSMHHDKDKGDIAITISFAYDWDPVYGGILHFCDKDRNIHTSVVPSAGNINIFKLDKEDGIEHFVSPVTVDKNRYTLIAWYWIIPNIII